VSVRENSGPFKALTQVSSTVWSCPAAMVTLLWNPPGPSMVTAAGAFPPLADDDRGVELRPDRVCVDGRPEFTAHVAVNEGGVLTGGHLDRDRDRGWAGGPAAATEDEDTARSSSPRRPAARGLGHARAAEYAANASAISKSRPLVLLMDRLRC